MDDRDAQRPRAGAEPGGVPPVRAFLLLALAAMAVVGGLAMFGGAPAEPSAAPAPRRSPDYSLTDAEAVAEFERLHAQFRAASKNRDQSMVDVMLTSDSPLHGPARRQIRQLIADGVIDRSRFHQESVEVVSNSPTEIAITQVVVIQPRFISEGTGDVVSAGSRIRQEVHWVLALEGSSWKVYDSEVVSSRSPA